MVESPTIHSLREALAPVEALRGEQSQFEGWIRESFAAMEVLHGELSQWQRDLTREQAALDQREAEINDAASASDSEAIVELERQLAQSRDETRQLEEENAEQLQALDDLERQLAVVQAESRLVHKHADDVARALEIERERSVEEHGHWMAELRELRRVMERHGAMLSQVVGRPLNGEPDGHDLPSPAGYANDEEVCIEPASEAACRAAELRRRANSRRATQRRPS